jgi:hypothetical protein
LCVFLTFPPFLTVSTTKGFTDQVGGFASGAQEAELKRRTEDPKIKKQKGFFAQKDAVSGTSLAKKQYKSVKSKFKKQQTNANNSSSIQNAAAKTSGGAALARAFPETETGTAGLGKIFFTDRPTYSLLPISLTTSFLFLLQSSFLLHSRTSGCSEVRSPGYQWCARNSRNSSSICRCC